MYNAYIFCVDKETWYRYHFVADEWIVCENMNHQIKIDFIEVSTKLAKLNGWEPKIENIK